MNDFYNCLTHSLDQAIIIDPTHCVTEAHLCCDGKRPLAESMVLKRGAEIWRERLMNISDVWGRLGMKALNEAIARRANTEEQYISRYRSAN